MGLSNKLSCEAGNFSHCCNPPRFLPPEVLRLYILMMDPWIGWSDLLSICSSWFIHMQIWDLLVHQPLPYQPVPSPATLPESSPPWLPVSAPPTGLDECFFFNSLVVGLAYNLIFWQFWLFFVFKFFVVLILVVQGGKVYVPMPPSRLEV